MQCDLCVAFGARVAVECAGGAHRHLHIQPAARAAGKDLIPVACLLPAVVDRCIGGFQQNADAGVVGFVSVTQPHLDTPPRP